MREFFATWNIAEHLTTDEGPQMMSEEVQTWLASMDVTHRATSAYYPHSNSRAELAVKSRKRMLQDSMTQNGNIDNDKFLRAVLQYAPPRLQEEPSTDGVWSPPM